MKSIGEQFNEAREERGITLSDAAARTQIKVQQLQDLENDDYSKIPAPVYAKGFIKLYAQHLGLDPKALVAQYEHDFLNKPSAEELAVIEPAAVAPESKLKPEKKWLKKEAAPTLVDDQVSTQEPASVEEDEVTPQPKPLKEWFAINNSKAKPVLMVLGGLFVIFLFSRLFQGENVLEKGDLLKASDVLIEHPAEPYITMD